LAYFTKHLTLLNTSYAFRTAMIYLTAVTLIFKRAVLVAREAILFFGFTSVRHPCSELWLNFVSES